MNREYDRLAVYFPGSTIGNLGPADAVRLMRQMAEMVQPGGGLLIGVDLKKSPHILEPAYNDRAGVTADFNLNLLVRINRELGADFDLNSFAHRAFFNEACDRVEMHLVSCRPQIVRLGGSTFKFATGESIHTECSYKYSREKFADLAADAGFQVCEIWTDENDLFSVQYLRAFD